MSSNARYYTSSIYNVGLFLWLLFIAPPGLCDSAKKILAKEEAIREEMLQITQELGVTCATCHEVDDFKKANKAAFQIAREHFRVVRLLSENGFDGKHGPQASCLMCHRGKLKPDYQNTLPKASRHAEADAP